MKKDLEIIKALIMEMNASYKKSGLKHPEKADLDKNKKISSYEKKRGKAVEKNLKKEINTPNPPTDYSGKPAIPGLGPIVGMKEDATDDKIDRSELEMLKKMYKRTPTDKIKAMIDKLEAKLGVNENHEGQDHEVSMANNSLDSILWAANELKKHLGDQERDIPAWIQDHITNAENYILQAAKNFHDYGQEEAPEGDLGLTNEDLMSTLGGEKPFGDSEMRKNIVEPNLGPNYDAYIMFQGPEDQYDQAKKKYVKNMENWEQLYRSSNSQGYAYISPDGNVIKASILSRGGYDFLVGAIYVKKENEMSLQEMVKKVGKKYNVYSKKGKKLGSHPSKKKAQKQMAAIEISKQGK